MRQSRLMSFVETITNVLVGYGIAVVIQILTFPIFGLQAALGLSSTRSRRPKAGGGHCREGDQRSIL